MLKEAIQYIRDTAAPYIREFDGQAYSDKEMTRVVKKPCPAEINLSTLTGLKDYLMSESLNNERVKDLIIHVRNPIRVSLYSKLDEDQKRLHYVDVIADLPQQRFDQYLDQENFIIELKTKFVPSDDPSDDINLLVKFAGTAEGSTLRQYKDDGFSQAVTVADGIASKTDAEVPNPVTLRPFRTFHEVEQPESLFVFRMKESDGMYCAIYEADGGAWKNAAVQNIKRYLEDFVSKLPEDMQKHITVIA
jgi:hypothetical protein